ncbi:hypothetical protein E2L05_15955 [Meridianimarinicoccus aquatilis]|uniref:Uncharacterized protein n=1 Tax=Meridianimarinicoccus aquatilis TaxID=2552766 RepID=A0A4R6AT23_9RHOB|nr:hypothetical protein E2L05_15955 [Fluviibacterium aquatile]
MLVGIGALAMVRRAKRKKLNLADSASPSPDGIGLRQIDGKRAQSRRVFLSKIYFLPRRFTPPR